MGTMKRQWPKDVDRCVLDEVDSTNLEALRRAPLGRAQWLMARRQVSAKGRRGRVWQMSEGNFAASLLFFPKEGPAERALRSFSAALAVLDALRALQVFGDLTLKWPNDVLLNGRKLAGILLETSGDGLVVGIGVNLRHAPDLALIAPGAVPPASVFAETGQEIAPEALLEELAMAFAAWEARFQADGFAPIRTAWLGQAARLGETITARLPGRDIKGRFETVDLSGQLVLDTASGRETIAAADVFF